MKKLMIVGVAASVLVACGGNSFSGTVKGTTLNPQDGIFLVSSAPGDSGQAMLLLLSDQPKLCEQVKANHLGKNETSLHVFFGVTDNSGFKPLVPGSYKMTDGSSDTTGNGAVAGFDKTDGSCNSTLGSAALLSTGGTATLSSFEAKVGGSAIGMFDINFGADHVTGAFHASFCDAPRTNDEPTCN